MSERPIISSKALQRWLCSRGQIVAVDGTAGAETRAAIDAAFTNLQAKAIKPSDIDKLAKRLGCTPKQLRAMATVESGRSGFDDEGRPKILFERHLFDRLTGGKHSVCSWSNPKGGGYSESSWDKLKQAASADAAAAFMATSWGKFQVLGLHYEALSYSTPLELAYTTVISEAGHYEMLARYIEQNNLSDPLARLSTNPDDNRALAKGYNGPAYERFEYHLKLARAMA